MPLERFPDTYATSRPSSSTVPTTIDRELAAIMRGPIVLAGLLGDDGITPANRRARPSAKGTEPWDEAVNTDLDPSPPAVPGPRSSHSTTR